MAVVQVDRDLVPAKCGGGHRQIIVEANEPGFAVFPEECWARILTIVAPDICLAEVRMELMEAGLAKYLVREMDRCELGPARMGRSISFTCSEIRKLGWLRIQGMVVRGKRSREIIHERMMWGTG